MPSLGEIKNSEELAQVGIFYKHKSKYMWVSCPDCKKERWVSIRHSPKRYDISPEKPHYICQVCSMRKNALAGRTANNNGKGEGNNNWKGGKIWMKPSGYAMVRIYPEDFFYPMRTSDGYVLEHRLVMAKYLGRNLQKWELVHHKNGKRDDNRLENLELSLQGNHIRMHSKGYKDGYIKGLVDGHSKAIKDLQARVTLLEAENVLLKAQSTEGGVPFTSV